MTCRKCGAVNGAVAKSCKICHAPLMQGPGMQAATGSEKTCPYCAERIKLEAKRCRFCHEWLVPDEERGFAVPLGAEASPESIAEAGELAGWQGKGPLPPVLSIGSYIALGLVVACFIAGWFAGGEREGPGIGCAVAILPGLIALIAVVNDLNIAGSRSCSTPEKAAKYFIMAMKARKWGCASMVCVDSPTAARRNARSKSSWKSAARTVGSNGQINGVRIINLDDRGETALVQVQVEFFSGSIVGCVIGAFLGLLIGVILYYVMGTRETRQYTKLLVKRGGRWWIVNSLPDDRLDNRLANAMGL